VFVLIAVKMNKKLQTTFNYYIVNLAITDVAVAVTAMSFMATHTVLGYWPFGEALCALWIFFDYGKKRIFFNNYNNNYINYIHEYTFFEYLFKDTYLIQIMQHIINCIDIELHLGT
jgi:hypothetical protein